MRWWRDGGGEEYVPALRLSAAGASQSEGLPGDLGTEGSGVLSNDDDITSASATASASASAGAGAGAGAGAEGNEGAGTEDEGVGAVRSGGGGDGGEVTGASVGAGVSEAEGGSGDRTGNDGNAADDGRDVDPDLPAARRQAPPRTETEQLYEYTPPPLFYWEGAPPPDPGPAPAPAPSHTHPLVSDDVIVGSGVEGRRRTRENQDLHKSIVALGTKLSQIEAKLTQATTQMAGTGSTTTRPAPGEEENVGTFSSSAGSKTAHATLNALTAAGTQRGGETGLLRQILGEVATLNAAQDDGEGVGGAGGSVLGRLFVELTYLQRQVKEDAASGKPSASARAHAAGADAAEERAKRLSSGLLRIKRRPKPGTSARYATSASSVAPPPPPPAHSPQAEEKVQEWFQQNADEERMVALTGLVAVVQEAMGPELGAKFEEDLREGDDGDLRVSWMEVKDRLFGSTQQPAVPVGRGGSSGARTARK